MNIKDFKNVTTKPCNIEFDEKYLNKLSQLPKTSPKRHTIEIISTIAAAVLIVLAVGLWAIIGRGIRDGGVQVVAGSYAETEVTSELNAQLNMDLFGKYDVFCFREFDEKNPLSVHELLQINRYAKNAFYKGTEGYVTGKMINDYAKKMFGISPAHDFAIYGCEVELGDVDYAGAKTTKITTEDLTDGTKKIHIEYTEFIHKYVLEYVGYDIFSPIRFTAFYKDDTELSKTYADEKIYKVLCDELDADGYVESYLLYLPEAPTETDDGVSAKIILNYSFTDGKPHSILGSIKEYKDKQTAELVCNFEKTDKGLKLIKENGEGDKPTLTNVTEWFEDLSYKNLKDSTSGKEPTPSIKSVPKTKEFEFLGKKYNLKLKGAFYQGMTFPLYQYTDGNGTGFLFTENGELTEYEFGGIFEKTGTVTKDEATEIAKDFARQMFGEQFDDYAFNDVTEIGPSGPTEKYIVSFSKKYGKDGYLSGEYCSVDVKINGDVIRCGNRSLYEFKKRDMSIFENITEADIKKKALSAYSQDGYYTYTVESASVSFVKEKALISVGVMMTGKEGTSAGIMRYFEVTEK